LAEEGFPYNINSCNALNNWNAMHFAVFNDNTEMVNLLLKYGAKVFVWL
jgi:ankyrin repeat protein